jgi:hypothetical protein
MKIVIEMVTSVGVALVIYFGAIYFGAIYFGAIYKEPELKAQSTFPLFIPMAPLQLDQSGYLMGHCVNCEDDGTTWAFPKPMGHK